MNNNKKLNLVCGIIMSVAVAFMLIGLICGASTGFYLDTSGVHINGKTDRYHTEKKFGDIDSMIIDASFADVVVKSGPENKVELSGTKKHDIPDVSFAGNELIVTMNKRHRGFKISFFDFPDTKTKITVYLKEGTKLNNTKIETSFGSVKTNMLNTKRLNIDSSFGEVTVNATSEEIIVDTSFGEVTIDSTSKRLTTDSSFGQINATIRGVEKINATSSFGDINLYVDGVKNNYNIEKNSSFGEINTEGTRTDTPVTKMGSIILDNSFGNINLKFLK